jgi:hypothetical protein
MTFRDTPISVKHSDNSVKTHTWMHTHKHVCMHVRTHTLLLFLAPSLASQLFIYFPFTSKPHSQKQSSESNLLISFLSQAFFFFSTWQFHFLSLAPGAIISLMLKATSLSWHSQNIAYLGLEEAHPSFRWDNWLILLEWIWYERTVL